MTKEETPGKSHVVRLNRLISKQIITIKRHSPFSVTAYLFLVLG